MTSVRIFVTSAGNEFMHDIALLVQDGFVSSGVECRLGIDEVPTAGPGGELQLVVAPHEFGTLFLARRLGGGAVATSLSHTWALNVEQPGSRWFEAAWDFARLARGVFDISPEGVAEFRRRGIPTHHVPLGYASRLAAPSPTDPVNRSVDVLFLGHDSTRRQAFFARHADFFASRNCHLVLADVTEPRHTGAPGYYSGQARLDLVASARIVLNVHSNERTYFEWHRALLAIANGCLLVTETSRHTAPLVHDHHFLEGDLEALPELCRRHLDDLPTLTSIASAGLELVRRERTMATACGAMLAVVESTGTRPPRSGAMASQKFDPSTGRKAVLERIGLARARRGRGEPTWNVQRNRAHRGSPGAAVSVVITLHDYERYIDECITSVVRADAVPGGTEIVVVDDASTDGSVGRVEALMSQVDLPLMLVVKHLNTGLAEARNIGVQHARGRHVFMLDADNWIYPSCLRVLSDALADRRHAAAYGLLKKFDGDTGEALGLLSSQPWNPRQLVRGPYIDAMALFDRTILQAAGGYATELIEHGWFGWEDYDLWLALAQAGHTCVLVPRVLGAYRVHSSSMLHRTNQNTAGIARHLRVKFRPLMERHSGLEHYFGFPDDAAIAAGRFEAPSLDSWDLPATVRRLERQVDAMRTSWSWRLTAPLRCALRRLRGQ